MCNGAALFIFTALILRSNMRDYILPIPGLKKIEPILTEYFGYKRAMFENELSATYYHEYPNGISEDICKNYMTDYSFLNTGQTH